MVSRSVSWVGLRHTKLGALVRAYEASRNWVLERIGLWREWSAKFRKKRHLKRRRRLSVRDLEPLLSQRSNATSTLSYRTSFRLPLELESLLPGKSESRAIATKSSLLSLPAEIRMQIYVLCYQDREELDIQYTGRWRNRFPEPLRPPGGSRIRLRSTQLPLLRPRGLISLPLACRQLYIETIDYMYKYPTFHFHHPDNVIAFQSYLLPQRWNCIESIHLSISYSYCHTDPYAVWRYNQCFSMKTWHRACQALAALPHLRTLTVDLYWELGSWINLDNALIPLMQITQVADFQVRSMIPGYMVRPLESFRSAPFVLLEHVPSSRRQFGSESSWQPYFERNQLAAGQAIEGS